MLSTPLTQGSNPKIKIGILAFGSLIGDPGTELTPKITMRLKVQTPFGVEYARYSSITRGGAPTLVPHANSFPVLGEILVLDDAVTFVEARNMLWRRERRREKSGEIYFEGKSSDSVLVRDIADSPIVSILLYTDFLPEGKDANPTVEKLSQKAIQSVKIAAEGKDGITYLLDNIAAGIKTSLTSDYEAEILKQTNTGSLQEAIKKVKTK